ncbi:MAG: hypothetical protein HKN79_07470, partial [Flavobacteriales bacterium]|nr:hypothetical protein [Flavobacteriales bacterium]
MKHAMWRYMSTMILLLASFTLVQAFGQETEPNDTFAEANTISLDQAVSGDLNLEDNGDVFDNFEIVLPENGDLTVELTLHQNFGVYIRIFDKTGLPLTSQFGSSGTF